MSFACSLITAVLLAQAPVAAPPPPVVPDTVLSPEVFPDRRVTLRLRAPKAAEVTVAGEWTRAGGHPNDPQKLSKDAAMARRVLPTEHSHWPTPVAMKPRAVRREMRGQPGTRLVSASRSNTQPAKMNAPNASDRKAVNCAKYLLEFGLCVGPMASDATPKARAAAI